MTTFLEFCDLLGVELTDAQRVLATVAFDGAEPRDLKGADRELARRLFGDLETIPAAVRAVLVQVAGARSGKSYLGALRLVHLAITVPLDLLAPGEIASAAIIAPDLKLARQALRFAVGAIQNTPALAALLDNVTADGFTLTRRDGHTVTVEALAATRGGAAARGRTFVAVLLDEAAFFRDEASVVNDQAIYEAVSPRVVTGGQLLIVSTAWSETGLLFKFFTEQHGKPRNALVAHAPTLLMRPSMRARVEAAYESDPVVASREFGAEFLSAGAGAYFDAAAVAACVEKGRSNPLAPDPTQKGFAAADFAFNSDHSALVIVRVIDGRATLVDWLELKPQRGLPLKPSEVVAQFAQVMKRHGVTSLNADHHYKESVREHLEARGLRFATVEGGNTGKLKAYGRTQALIREERASLPQVPRLIAQLKDVTVKPLPGGSLQISHPRRSGAGHGDLSAALVLGLAAAWSDVQRCAKRRDRGAAPGPARATYEMRAALDAPDAGVFDRMQVRGNSVVVMPRAALSRLAMRGNRFGGGGF